MYQSTNTYNLGEDDNLRMRREYPKLFFLFVFALVAALSFSPLQAMADTSEAEEELAPPPEFTKEDRFFEVIEDGVPVYDNSTGTLIKVGELVKGQVYPRIRDYGRWHEISLGHKKGYVRKQSTQPVHKHQLKNLNQNQTSSSLSIKITESAVVYDNTSGKLIPFATLEKGQTYPVIRSYGAWWRIDVSGRIGYIRKNLTQVIPNPIVNPRQKYSYKQMENDIQLLEMMYPDIIEKKIIGQSVDGRNIYAIKLGKGKKEVMINASHHAREHITTNLVMKMLDEYAYAYHKNRSIDGYNVRKVLDQTSIWFVPMVNPDGVTLVQQGHHSAKNPQRALKLNRNKKSFLSWKANIRGVDLNRQYPTLWNSIVNDPGKPSPENYKGPKPLSEPETRAMYRFTQEHSFQAVISYHSSGELNLSRLDAAPGSQALGKKISQKTKYPLINISKRKSGGGYSDWFAITQKKPAFTLEVAPYAGPRPVPMNHWDRVWTRNNSVGLILAQHAP